LRVPSREEDELKRKITLSIESNLIEAARKMAAQRGSNLGSFLATELARIVKTGEAYERAKARAIARLASPSYLGGKKMPSREELHDRKSDRGVL
jgi:hypothetical protein